MCPPPEVGTLGLALVEAEIYVTNSAHLWQVLFYCLPGGNYPSKALLKYISPCCHLVPVMQACTTGIIAHINKAPQPGKPGGTMPYTSNRCLHREQIYTALVVSKEAGN